MTKKWKNSLGRSESNGKPLKIPGLTGGARTRRLFRRPAWRGSTWSPNEWWHASCVRVPLPVPGNCGILSALSARSSKRVFENRQVRASRLVMVVIMAMWVMASWGRVGFVGAHAAAVLDDPRETSLDHPDPGRTWKPVAPGRRLIISIVRVRTSFAQISGHPG